MKMKGAEAVVACLLEQGVDTVFGYPGGQILPLYDALYDAPLKHILTVHEQGAAHAADGYARVSGKPGVCIVTSGPGATNLITGLAAAYLDSVPVVAITGQVPTGLLGKDSFQEVDITGISMTVTKHNFLVKDPAKIPAVMRQAFKIACSGRPGPVLVDLPKDVQVGVLDFYPAAPQTSRRRNLPEKTTAAALEAAKVLSLAERPVMVVGGGIIRGKASGEVRRLAEKCTLPVASTLMGLGAVAGSDCRFLGLTGMHGQLAANNAVSQADVLLIIGSRLSERVTGGHESYADGKKIIHIDIDRTEVGKNVDATIGLVGEITAIVKLICDAVQPRDLSNWWQSIAAWRQNGNVKEPEGRLNAPWIMKEISRQTTGSRAIFATDVGQNQMWAAQHLVIDRPDTWITSGGLGAMGFGLPAAMGAQAGDPDSRVVVIAGDGGFKMTAMELYTIATYELPVIAVVIDNQCLGMVRQWQQLFFRKRYSASLSPRQMDFVAHAESCGVSGRRVTTPEEFSGAFAEAWAKKKPMVIIAEIETEDLVVPMVAPGSPLDEYVDIG